MTENNDTTRNETKGFADFQNQTDDIPEPGLKESATDKPDELKELPAHSNEIVRKKKASRSNKSVSIGIIGGQNTGKTIYLYALRKQMEILGFEGDYLNGWTIGALSREYEIFCGEMDKLENLGDHQRTKTTELGVFDLFPMKRGKHEIILRAFNAAGENFDKAIDAFSFDELEKLHKDSRQYEVVCQLQKEILSCQAFIFLVDSELLMDLEANSKGFVLPPDRLLSTFRNFLLRELKIPTDSHIDIPVAFVLTKADYLPPDQDHINSKNLTNVTEKMCENFIRDYFRDFHSLTGQFHKKSFFAVSCLGKPPVFYTQDSMSPDKTTTIPPEKIASVRKQGLFIKTDIGRPDPINVEKPMVFLANELTKKIDRLKIKRRTKQMFFVSLIGILLLTYPWFAYNAGLFFKKQNAYSIAGICFIISGQHPLYQNPKFKKKIFFHQLELAEAYLHQKAYPKAQKATQAAQAKLASLVPDQNINNFKLKIAQLWITICQGYGEIDDMVSATDCLNLAEQMNINDKSINARKTAAVLNLKKMYNKTNRHEEGFSLIRQFFIKILTNGIQDSQDAEIITETKQSLKILIVHNIQSGNDSKAMEYLEFAEKNRGTLSMDKIELDAYLFQLYFNMGKKQIAESKIPEAINTLKKSLNAYHIGDSNTLSPFIKTIKENIQILGMARTLPLLSSAGRHIHSGSTEQQQLLDIFLIAADSELKSGNAEQGLEYLENALKIISGNDTQLAIVKIIQTILLSKNDEKKIQFLTMSLEKLGSFNTLNDLAVDIFIKIAREGLQNGEALKTYQFLEKETRLVHNPLFNKHLQHAKKAKEMKFIKGDATSRAFYIDPYEVSNKEYKAQIDRHSFLIPHEWQAPDYKSKSPLQDTPVIYISWDQAKKYSKNIGKRLPSVREWELAWQGDTYPWGKIFQEINCNTRESKMGKTVGRQAPLSVRDKGSNGVYCLVGNVAEYTKDTMRDEKNRLRAIVKGGSYIYTGQEMRRSKQRKIITTVPLPDVGFRCAMALLPD